jgi:aminoglycoside phosphotransferase (APT) family kinase protein
MLTAMAGRPGTTHCLQIRGGVVVKRFRSHARGEPGREWRALRMLARYAPGLAPAPVHAALDAEPPVVVMSRLPGSALGTRPLTPGEAVAVAASIGRLHRAAPPGVLDAAEPMPFGPVAALARVRAMAAALGIPEDPQARRALRCASTWLARGPVERAAARGCTTVFGHGDANLANYLHDGGTVRLVDFEDSGRSDRAWELAIFTEHLSVHGHGQVPAELALGQFETGVAERARIREYRRLLATFWLLMLLPGGPSHRRNPPGTLQHQTFRLLDLLG